MRYSTPVLLIACALSLASHAGVSRAESASSNLPVTELKFFDTGVGPLKAAPAFGDLGVGKHGTFVKLPAGFVSPLHTHTEDYYGVVVTGVVANAPSAEAKDVTLPAGSYWFQKGQEAHVTKCLSANECVVFIAQPGKFDYVNTH